MSSKRVKRGGRYKKHGHFHARGGRPQYIVRFYRENPSIPANSRRCINFADARKVANIMMDSATARLVTIEGPTGMAEFVRADVSPGIWLLDHSTLEELPMPGGEDL